MQTFSIFGPNFYGTSPPPSSSSTPNTENLNMTEIFSRVIDFFYNLLNPEIQFQDSGDNNTSTQTGISVDGTRTTDNPIRAGDDYVVSELLFFDNNSLNNGLTITEINENTSLESITTSEEDFICSICQNQIENSIFRKINSCSHCFHVSCIDNWLVRNNSCPYCRVNLTTERPQTRRSLSNLVSLRLFPNNSES